MTARIVAAVTVVALVAAWWALRREEQPRVLRDAENVAQHAWFTEGS